MKEQRLPLLCLAISGLRTCAGTVDGAIISCVAVASVYDFTVMCVVERRIMYNILTVLDHII